MTKKWTAIAREAALASEHLGIGVTALGRATYTFPAYYSQAFFALSIGLERACKLALAVHHAITNKGQFPTERALKLYGHDLRALIKACADLAQTHYGCIEPFPASFIHANIIDILSDFSSNITRYYNIQVITESAASKQVEDPIGQWHKRVVEPVLRNCCKPEQIEQVRQRAAIVDALAGSFTFVRQTALDGSPLTNAFEASTQTGLISLSTPYVRLHVLQIARPLAKLFAELGYQAQAARNEDIPYLSEFFTLFMDDDQYFKTRKVWSTYPKSSGVLS